MAAAFTDSNGRTWEPRVTVLVDKEFASTVGVTIHQALLEKPEVLSGMQVYDLVWLAIKRQAVERDVSMDNFFSSLEADSAEEAVEATMRAVIDYFPDKDPRKKAMTALWTRLEKTVQAGRQEMEKMVEEIEQLSDAEILSGLSNSPESPEATTPSENSSGEPATSESAT